MGPFILAWMIGEGIIVYRSVTKTKAPPVPGTLLATSGLFALLALVAESDKARPVAVALAFGFDLAAFMNLYPPVTDPEGNAAPAENAAAPAESNAAGSRTVTGST
jgi:hypothetical protein